MPTMTTAERAAKLRALLDCGALRAVDGIDTLHGLSAPPELAARIVLAHLDYLSDLETTGTFLPARRQAVEEDIERLLTGIRLARPGIPG